MSSDTLKPKACFVLVLFLLWGPTSEGQILNKIKRIAEGEVKEVLKEEAITQLEKSRDAYDKIDFNYAVSFSDNSGLYESEEKFRRYQKILITALKADNLENRSPEEKAEDYNEAGEMFYASNKFRAAEVAFIAALGIYEYHDIAHTKDAALTISNLGLVMHSKGRFNQAEKFTLRGLELRRDELRDDRGYSSSLNNLAVLYKDMGRYNEAEKLFEEAIRLTRETIGENSAPMSIILNNKAMLLQTMGRYEQAEQLMRNALSIAGMVLKEKSANLIRLRTNLALLYQQMGRLDEAEQIYREALEMQERRLGNKHPDYAVILRNMASLYQEQGRTDKVEEYLQEALSIYRLKFGGRSAHVAKSHFELAAFYQSLDRIAEAEEHLNEAIEIQERILGEHHPDLVRSWENRAVLAWQKGNPQAAYAGFTKVLDEYIYQINNYFPPMSEHEKARFWQQIQPRFNRFYSFVAAHHQDVPGMANSMYNYHIATKALLLNSSYKIKNQILQSGNQELIKKYKEWTDTRKELARLYTLSNEELMLEKVSVDSMERAANRQEKELSDMSGVFRSGMALQSAGFRDVKAALDPESAAMEIVRVQDYNYLLPDTAVSYLGLIVQPNSEEVLLRVIDEGKKLEEKTISEYRKNMQRAFADNQFMEDFWDPLAGPIKKYGRVYLSLDGVYNQINVNTLQNAKGDFVLDQQDIVYLTNTKDLLGMGMNISEEYANRRAVLIGNPNYAKDLDWGKITELPLPELPGTEEEVKKIDTILKNQNWNTASYTGNAATENLVKNSSAPNILHIATHGFFLEDPSIGGGKLFGIEPVQAEENPLLRSGLMFTGADNTIQQIGDPASMKEEDGILNAYEAMLISLDQTSLVVLSACETGLGEIRNGEGVYGLQRALQIAGAERIIISLWQVSDEVTQKLMTAFYQNYLQEGDKIKAFRDAQLSIKSEYPEPFYWGAFVLINK